MILFNPVCVIGQQRMELYNAITADDAELVMELFNNNDLLHYHLRDHSLIKIAAKNENKTITQILLENGAANPMNCDTYDDCIITAFIYKVSAEMADAGEKEAMYLNALSLYKLTREKYHDELTLERVNRTGKVCYLVTCWSVLSLISVFTGHYAYSTEDFGVWDKERKEHRKFLKSRIKYCDEHILGIEEILSELQR